MVAGGAIVEFLGIAGQENGQDSGFECQSIVV